MAARADVNPQSPTMTVPDAALELSIDQLINALEKKLFMECEGLQAAMKPMSRALVTNLTTKVRSREPEGNLEC